MWWVLLTIFLAIIKHENCYPNLKGTCNRYPISLSGNVKWKFMYELSAQDNDFIFAI